MGDVMTDQRIGVTITEFAQMMGRRPGWVRNQVRQGNIPVVQIGGVRLVPAWFIRRLTEPAA